MIKDFIKFVLQQTHVCAHTHNTQRAPSKQYEKDQKPSENQTRT